MPPDRGLSKTPKGNVKKETKKSTPHRSKTGDVSSNIKEDMSVSKDATLIRQKIKRTKDDDVTTTPKDRIALNSRTDAAKFKDVKKRHDKDLKKLRDTLSKSKMSSTSSSKVASALSPKVSLEQSVNSRISKAPTGSTKSSVTSISKDISLKANTKTKVSKSLQQINNSPKPRVGTSNLSQNVNASTKTRTRSNLPKQNSLDRKERGRHSVSDKQQRQLRERTRTRTLSPHEVRIVKQPPSEGSSQHLKVKAGIESEETKKPSSKGDNTSIMTASSSDQNEVDDDYENDFEDYESDFEEDQSETSDIVKSVSESESNSLDDSNSLEDEVVEVISKPAVEEEKKLDSGNYDLTESKRKGRELQQIKEALEKENANITNSRTQVKKTAVHGAQDEGFEEEKPDGQKYSRDIKNTVFINFANAKKKMEEQKVSERTKKRGEELLSMIQLDIVAFSLIDLPPVPYEVYIKSYGRTNYQQVSVQTNEENLCEEVQTDEILMENKWCQHPAVYRPIDLNCGDDPPFLTLSQGLIECGGETEEDDDQWKKQIKFDTIRLNRFLLNAGEAVLQCLEDQSNGRGNTLSPNPSFSYFSTGFFSLNVKSVPFLNGRYISNIIFSEIHPTRIITVHKNPEETKETMFSEKCVLCIWDILKPESPVKIFGCPNVVNCLCLHPHADNLIFSGLNDGTVCVWDINEPLSDHPCERKNLNEWIIRSPTYSTAEILKNEGHLSEICAIIPVGKSIPSTSINQQFPIQICSLEVAGLAIVWTSIKNSRSAVKTGLALQDLGIAFWGKVQLVRSIAFNVLQDLDLDSRFLKSVECRGMLSDPGDLSHFYVYTNSGHVIHCLSSGCKSFPKVFSSSEVGLFPATYLENAVDERYLLVGFEGGIIKLFCRKSGKCLATFSGTGDVLGQGPPVTCIQSSQTCPGQFFVLDKMSRIHVWNLLQSDYHPIKSCNLKKKISSMKLSRARENKPVYLAISTDAEVELHQLKPEFSQKSESEYNEEMQIFRAYIKQL